MKKKSSKKQGSMAVRKDADLHAPAPPKWYLCAIVLLNILVLYLNHLLISGHRWSQFLIHFDMYLGYLWFGVNIAMIWFLKKHHSKKSAYILPVYFVAFFLLLQLLGVYLHSTNTQLSEGAYTALVWSTTAFEVITALLQLKMRRQHARS